LADAAYLHAVFAERPGPPMSRSEVDDRVARRIAEANENGIHFYAVRLAHNTDVFGYCGLFPGRTGLDQPEVGYEVLSSMRNRGYAIEALQQVVLAAAATGRSRVWSTVRAWNHASLRVLEKVGFVRDYVDTDADGELVYLRRELIQAHP